jgi:ABC-2 type transport system ATP-binding protein
MIEVQNLVKWYGPTLAVDHLSFHIEPGQIVGFLGPNGAGKSTTLRILIGYLPPTEGRAVIDGFDTLLQSKQARRRIGYLAESNPLYPEMRVEEYLHFRGKLYHMDRAKRRARIDVVCARCGLGAVRRRLIGQLSRGNRQRLGLAQALLHDPPVLILDEPTAGLDPNQIGQFRTLIGELKGKHTILLSTHILPEVEKTADRVLIIAGGRIVAEGSPEELRRNVTSGAKVLVEVRAAPDAVVKAFRAVADVGQVETTMNDGWCRAVVTPRRQIEIRDGLAQALAASGWAVREMRHETASLEQFFVQITAAQAAGAASA